MADKYFKMFPTSGMYISEGQSIRSVQVRELEKITGIEVVVTLWDETVTRGSLPRWCCESEDKAFIFFYVDHVLAPKLIGCDAMRQKTVDEILDRLIEQAVSLDNKLAKLARSVNWAMSVAVCKAGACCERIALYKYIAKLAERLDHEFCPEFETPTCSFNITNGGFKCPKNRLADQAKHLVILPWTANSFHQEMGIIKNIYDKYYKVPTVEIDDQNAVVEDDSSYTLCMKELKNCVSSVEKIIKDFGYEKKVSIGINIGASKFYTHNKTYRFNISKERICDGSPEISSDVLFEFYDLLLTEFDIETLEDPFHSDDRNYSSKLNKIFQSYLITEFDSLTDTDTFLKMMRGPSCNGWVVDQIGYVTKCIKLVLMSKSMDWVIEMSSHDSCETSDPFIADFCFGLSLNKLKIGVSCISSACNVCRRVCELEIESAKDRCRKYSKIHIQRFGELVLPYKEEYNEDEFQRLRIAKFKTWGIPLGDAHA